MREPFIGSEALAAGKVTRHQLRTRYFKLHQDIYVPNDISVTAVTLAKACWLRSRRRGILDTNRRPTPGVEVWGDRIGEDEICVIKGMPVTVPARTAFDLASRHPTGGAVAAIDALLQAGVVKVADIEQVMDRYKGRRWENVERLGWLIVRVAAEDHPDRIIRRVRDARARRT